LNLLKVNTSHPLLVGSSLVLLKTFLVAVLAAALAPAVHASASKLCFKDGPSSVDIEYSEAGGLLIPGYAKKDDVTQLDAALEATLKTYIDNSITTVSQDIDGKIAALQNTLSTQIAAVQTSADAVATNSGCAAAAPTRRQPGRRGYTVECVLSAAAAGQASSGRCLHNSRRNIATGGCRYLCLFGSFVELVNTCGS
jgi:hypothetical protein